MSLATAFTKFAKSSLEVLAHRLAIPQRQSNIGQLGGLGQICHFQKISEVRKLMKVWDLPFAQLLLSECSYLDIFFEV